MKYLGMISTCAVGMLMASCATQPPQGIDTAQIQAVRSSGLTVDSVEHATAVSIKTKAQAVGGAVLGVVAGAAVGSSGNPQSIQALQANQQAATLANQDVQVAASGYSHKVTMPTTPAQAMRMDLQQRLAKAAVHPGPASFHVRIDQKTWLLTYDSFFKSNDYRLHYAIETRLVDASGKVVTSSECAGESPSPAALDAWKADHYAKVTSYAAKVGTLCSKRLLSDIGLAG